MLCFRKFLVAKKFMDKRGDHDFPPKIFCLTVPKNFVGEPFSVSLVSVIEKIYASEGYVTIICRIFFVSVPKNFVGIPGIPSMFGVSKSFMHTRGYHNFPSKFFCHSAEKHRKGTL